MATIALYAGKINQMPWLIMDVKKSVMDYKAELFSMQQKALSINKSICNMDEVISSIRASTQIQEQKIESLETLNKNVEKFIADVVRIDNEVADLIRKRKDEFYSQYSYLRPEFEKSWLDDFGDGLASAAEWCKEHWKLIVTVALVVVAVALICTGVGGALAPLLVLMAKGLIVGAVTGGLMGGLSSLAAGGSFLAGFENGAFTGAITGAIFGGLGGAGGMLGSSCNVLTKLGGVARLMPTIAKVSGGIAVSMASFDLLSFGIGLFDPANLFVQLNQKLHSNNLYNTFQIGVSALAMVTGGFSIGMKNPACFVAGTMILTATGLVAIENIKVGDKVISTNTDTFKTAEKEVLETYIREVPKLVNLTINDELVSTTCKWH
jgi:hypothetical protein